MTIPAATSVKISAPLSTNTALTAAGYTTAPSAFYGMKLVLRDGVEIGDFDCQTAWSLPGMREAQLEADAIRDDLETLIARVT